MNLTSEERKPFFSILIPSYNRPEHITVSLGSILSNDFKDFEIVISDDNSPKAEAIEKAVQPYLKSNNVFFFKQAINLREPGNKNFLVSKAKGRYTIILGDDDKLYPQALGTIKKYIDANPTFDLYAFGYSVIDENDRFYYARHAPRAVTINLEDHSLVRELFFSDVFPFWLYHPATFCCRNGIEKEIPYSKDAGIGEDYLFVFDLISHGKEMFVIPEDLFSWRKIQRRETKGQRNQSLGDFSIIQARKNIYYLLQDRKDLHPFIDALVATYEYRKRFLYDPILHDEHATNENVLKLGLEIAHLDELNLYLSDSSYIDKHYKPYVRRSVTFVRLFGVKGLLQIALVSIERLYYMMKQKLRKDR